MQRSHHRSFPAMVGAGMVALVVLIGALSTLTSRNGDTTTAAEALSPASTAEATEPPTAAGYASVDGASAPRPDDPAGSASIETSTTSTTTSSTSSTTSTTEPAFPPLTQPLSYGMAGGNVERLQQRLDDLGFFVGPVDGSFGNLTRQAVWAFEKLVIGTPSSQATGVVTPEMWAAMNGDVDLAPRRSHAAGHATRNHTEIYLPEQVVAFYVNDEPVLISHMSSGDGKEWSEVVTIDVGEYGNENGTSPLRRREIGVSVTPPGVYRYNRFVEGTRHGALGAMWNPAYFNYGIAIHGAKNVPLEPASHGCIRIPLPVSEIFHQYVSKGDAVYVFDGVMAPEAYGAQLPIFNRVDPTWVDPDAPAPAVTTAG